ncbi:MAG: type VI secretion system baseplate subunit TssF, partial [Planctomycetota bacterium]
MDPRLLEYYKRELVHIRDMGGEFARDFPKIAGRLGLEGFECADPYVERLLEGFGFLAARVQLKIDSEFPRFTQHLLESVYPNYLSPTPSMAVVEFQPDMSEGALSEGYLVPRGTVLRGQLGKGEQTPCEYRTAHDVTLWPLEIREAEYYADARNLPPGLDLAGFQGIRAGIRVRLGTTAGLGFDRLALERLVLFLRGADELPAHVYEQLLANLEGILLCPGQREWQERLDASRLRRVGLGEEQALLPSGTRSFGGYRLLQEYFAFPERFFHVELSGMERAVRRSKGTELDLLFLLNRKDPVLENTLTASHFVLFCAPAINLFPRRADRIHLSDEQHEYHVIPDRTRPLDFEVHSVTAVTGYGTSAEEEQEFLPFYATRDLAPRAGTGAFYALRREPRVESSAKRARGARSSIAGSEVFISLVDAVEAPFPSGLRQLEVRALCTNRDLPLFLPVGQGRTDFTIESGAPVAAVRCVAGPTRPRPSHAEGR